MICVYYLKSVVFKKIWHLNKNLITWQSSSTFNNSSHYLDSLQMQTQILFNFSLNGRLKMN